MNIIQLVPRTLYETKMARERFRQVESCALLPNVTVHTTGPGWPDWNEKLSPNENLILYRDNRLGTPEFAPHLVVAYGMTSLAGSPIPVAIVLQEAYNRPKTLRLIEETDPRLVVFTYANEVPQYHDELLAADHVPVSIPHSGDDDLYKDYGEPKDIDILVVGNMNSTTYPFRARLGRLAWQYLRKQSYRVVVLQHPGYILPPKAGGLVGEPYARLLNRAKLVMTCTSCHRYALTKLVEIPLAGALPVSDLPAERQGFFKQTCLHVEPWMTDREILFLVEQTLDNEESWAARVKIAREKVAFRLAMRFWGERFVYWARRVILGEDPHPPMPPIGDDDAP